MNGNVCTAPNGRMRWKTKFGLAERTAYFFVESADLDHASNASASKSNCSFSDIAPSVSKCSLTFTEFAQRDKNYFKLYNNPYTTRCSECENIIEQE